LQDLVYLMNNHQLAQKYNIRDEIYPIALNNIDECNEWLVGQVYFNNNNNNEDREMSCWALSRGDRPRRFGTYM